jgi:hypothetical protein
MVLERDFVIVRPLANFYCMKLAKSRLVVRAQPVDATPSNQLIRQYFPIENRSVRLYSISTREGSGECSI